MDNLTLQVLEFFNAEKPKASRGIGRKLRPDGTDAERHEVLTTIRSLHRTGLLEKQGNTLDSAYKLTSAGVTLRDSLRKEGADN